MRNMKFGLMLAAIGASAPAMGGDIGVGLSVTIDQPGLYGRVDIGNVPPPVLVYPRPVVIVRPAPTVVVQEPLYLHVPPGHARHWRRHCHEYDACGRPVYFVQERWYNDVYVPARRERARDAGRGHADDRGRGHGAEHGHGGDHGHGHDRDRE